MNKTTIYTKSRHVSEEPLMAGYDKMESLKPDAEKSDWEAFCDNAAKWCAEHWQEIVATAGIAVVSTIGAATLNIVDAWGKVDNPAFNTLQSIFNWTSTISNRVYGLGMRYKIKGKGSPPEPIKKSSDGLTIDVYDGVKQASGICLKHFHHLSIVQILEHSI